MIIIRSDELENNCPIKSFQDYYKDVPGENICKFFALAKGDGSEDPDKTALFFIRLFIENGKRAKKNQKYVLGLCFYNFGDMVTIDIVSLDKQDHRDIVQEHANRMNWLVLESKHGSKYFDAYGIPMFVVGAYLQVDANDVISPFFVSGDFGNNLLGFDVNDVVEQIAFFCDLNKEGNRQGKNFFEELFLYVLQNKKQKNFYENFVKHFIRRKLTGQNFSSLLTMKVTDRVSEEGEENLLKILVEEVTQGFYKKCSVIYAGDKIKDVVN